jgi:hypothetical protein
MAEENNGAGEGNEGSGEGAGSEAAKAAEAAKGKGEGNGAANGSGEGSNYDWRGKLAGEDKKFRKLLDRYTDEPSFGKAFQEANTRASDPRRLMIPGEDATDEDRAAFAKARGIPDDPKKYEIKAKPPEGYEVTESDKARLEALTSLFHKKGGILADPAVVNAVHEAYYREQEEAAAYAQATAARQAELTNLQLGKLWPGAEKNRNLSFAKAAASHFFGAEWDELKDMQFADGSLLGDNLQFIKAFAKIGRLTMEDPIFLEAGRNGADPSKTLLDKKAAIMRLRSSDPKAYAEAARDGGELDQINEAIARHEERAGASM